MVDQVAQLTFGYDSPTRSEKIKPYHVESPPSSPDGKEEDRAIIQSWKEIIQKRLYEGVTYESPQTHEEELLRTMTDK